MPDDETNGKSGYSFPRRHSIEECAQLICEPPPPDIADKMDEEHLLFFGKTNALVLTLGLVIRHLDADTRAKFRLDIARVVLAIGRNHIGDPQITASIAEFEQLLAALGDISVDG